MRTVACFLAVILIGTSATWCAQARPYHHAKHGGSHSAAGDTTARGKSGTGDQPPVKTETTPQENGGLAPKGEPRGLKGDGVQTAAPSDERAIIKGGNSPGSPPDMNAIDTRITVMPHRPNGKPNNKTRQSKFVLIKSKQNVVPRRQSGPPANGGIARNSVGTLIPQQADSHGRDSGHSPPSTPVNAVTGAKINVVPGGGQHVIPQSKPNFTAHPLPFNSGTINAAGSTRPRNGSGTVGGPPRMLAGIGGNMFKPKY
jgi:hypothetical protein